MILPQIVCPVAKCKYGIRFSIKGFSCTWKNSVLSKLHHDFNYRKRAKCRSPVSNPDEVSYGLHDLEQLTSFLFDSICSSVIEEIRKQ